MQRDLFGRKGEQSIAVISLKRQGNPVRAAAIELRFYESMDGIPTTAPAASID
jgi:hypothetical protein